MNHPECPSQAKPKEEGMNRESNEQAKKKEKEVSGKRKRTMGSEEGREVTGIAKLLSGRGRETILEKGMRAVVAGGP